MIVRAMIVVIIKRDNIGGLQKHIDLLKKRRQPAADRCRPPAAVGYDGLCWSVLDDRSCGEPAAGGRSIPAPAADRCRRRLTAAAAAAGRRAA